MIMEHFVVTGEMIFFFPVPVIVAINKIDLPHADPVSITDLQLFEIGFHPLPNNKILHLSKYKAVAGQRKKKYGTLNPFPNKPWFLRVCSTSLLKRLLEKEKLLVTSNFSFSHSVFSTVLENFLSFSSNLKWLSANSFNLEESKICCLGKG